MNTEETKTTEAEVKDNLISIKDFAKVELKVGQILEAEKIEESEKLIKLKVSLAEENPRQIIAGIAKHYAAEELIGRKVIVVSNLKPAKLMGQLSEGMLLAASDGIGNLELISVGGIIPAGSRVG